MVIADMIAEVLTDVNNVDAAKKVRQRVRELTTRFHSPTNLRAVRADQSPR